MTIFDKRFSFIVEYFVIKNPAKKSSGEKITNYPISFEGLKIIKHSKTKIINELKNNRKVIISKVNSIKEIDNLIIALESKDEIVLIKKDCYSQLDELFRVVRNALAHGNFITTKNQLICWSNNKRNIKNGFVKLDYSTFLYIIELVFNEKFK